MTEATTPRSRVLDAIRGERVDPIPVGAVTQTATLAQMEQLAVRWPEAHVDGEQMARLAEGARTILGFDMVRVPFDQTVEAGLLGLPVELGGELGNCSVRDHTNSLDGSVPELPDFDQGRAKAVVDAIALLRKGMGEDAAVIGGVVGPYTLAGQMVGLMPLLMDSLRSPEKIRPLLDFAVKAAGEYAKRQIEAGADAICVEDMSAGLDLTSPTVFGNLILEPQQQLIESIQAPVVLHVCGGNTKILDLLFQTGAAALSLEAKTDLAAAAKGSCSVIGGVPTVEVLLQGEPEDVRRASVESLQAGVHILSPGCGIPVKTSTGNLLEMARAAREWEAHRS
jgi:[methyl-Co(III) methanol-specific corrinoid protein]:coenzyme M methyltransferase